MAPARSRGDHSPRLAIFSKFSAHGGVSRMMVNLANEIARRGIAVDLLVPGGEVPYPDTIAPEVTVIDFGKRHVYATLPALCGYLRRQRPDALLATRYRAEILAVVCGRLLAPFTGARPRVALRLSGAASSSAGKRGALRRWQFYLPFRRLFPLADRIIAVSRGVAADFRGIVGQRPLPLEVLPNPAIPDNLARLADEPAPHPWLEAEGIPVILGVGRLTRRKDFATLVRAFAQVRARRQCRLIILGDGGQRQALTDLAEQLGVAEDMALPGFSDNPFPWIARSSVVVLSSSGSEGSPNVLTEAMALGIPVASTDCPSGPREILQGGQLGPLAPIGDDQALAEGIEQQLDKPPSAETLQKAVVDYTVGGSADRYLETLGLPR